MNETERILWVDQTVGRSVQCVMRSCCSGAELQILVTSDPEQQATVVLRELYPTKSDLYERARLLEAQYREVSASLQKEGERTT